MPSIGEIISTPQGLAVVVQVLPTTIKDGSQVLGQVVAQALGGGPSLPPVGSSASGSQSGSPSDTVFRSIQAQAATAFVASVVEQPTTTVAAAAATTGGSPTGSTGSTGSSSGTGQSGSSAGGGATSGTSGIPSTAFFSAAQAYQSAQQRAEQAAPTLQLIG